MDVPSSEREEEEARLTTCDVPSQGTDRESPLSLLKEGYSASSSVVEETDVFSASTNRDIVFSERTGA